jgi:uncharacterized LabA/DUF88 family protein
MLFIDGDNLLARYEAMCTAGYTPHSTVTHEPDSFVWSPQFAIPLPPPYPNHVLLQRAYYYCSVVGAHEKLATVESRLKSLAALYELPAASFCALHPVVFKKENRKDKASGIDVRMAVDALTHIYNDNLDVISIVSGDGDFLPVAEEAIRRGKKVHVAALSSGLNARWKRAADVFTDLDSAYFDLSTRPEASRG